MELLHHAIEIGLRKEPTLKAQVYAIYDAAEKSNKAVGDYKHDI